MCTFTIIGDNGDQNIKPRDMWFDKQVTSIHAFHMYAAKDYVDGSSLPDDKPVRDLEAVPISTFMSSTALFKLIITKTETPFSNLQTNLVN